MTESIEAQKACAVAKARNGYVCLLRHGPDWHVVKTCKFVSEAQSWWDSLRAGARVYRVRNGEATLIMAR